MRRKCTPNQFAVEGDAAFIYLTDKNGADIAVAIIDVEDLGRVLAVGRWFANRHSNGFYAKAKKGRVILHRFIASASDSINIDHRNHDTLDCRKANLRECSHTENMQNRKSAHRQSQSGVRNVMWDKRRSNWRVIVRANKRRVEVGRFATIEEAELAAIEARKLLHGEFAA